ncbi:G patch domain-containing protein 4 [Hippoglossus hippoglossus]|uniref:G patch domain-containing protein 4 n=1 Tax=Hippoglossus hippoglossus TaxID=8267 RepID=UPI00148D3EB7|nr:G patch domain-containing protein 4 [Hippoglossus hippoglossus]
MAEVVPEKSRALKFAEQQLLRHGWEHGKGLGRDENGICEAIKVNVKCGKGGVGHKEGEQFSFHWWDHVFNKASSSLQVESDQDGIKLKKTVEEEEDGMISNKKPRKAWLAKDKLYGCFVKSATLLSGQEQPEPKASDSDDSSSSDEEDDRRLDLSSTTKLSDADLMKACGGRTAHKGARHGLTMSAKLARLEQQEAEFMAKYGKKSQPPAASPVCGKPAPPTAKAADERVERPEETADDAPSRKMKKKRKSSTLSVIEVSESPEADVKPKKKKKKADEEITAVSTENGICVENCEMEHSHKTKRKQKKKKKNKAEQNEEERTTSPAAESESPEETAELHTVTQVKKKKSSSKHHSEVEESNETESSQSEPAQDCAPKTKKRRAAVLMEEEVEVAEVESTVKQKRTKCKKDKPLVDDKVNEEALAPKKKKKKKKCKE